MTEKNKISGIVYALISSGTFGLIPLFTIPLIGKWGMSEENVLFYRYAFSMVAIGIMCLLGRTRLTVPLKVLGRIFLLSLMYAGTGIALIYSYNYIASGIVTTIHFLYPVIVAFMMVFLHREKFSKSLLGAALATIAGVGLLSGAGSSGGNMTGIVLAISTAITYALYIVGLKQKALEKTDGKVIVFYVILFGTVIFGGLSFFTTGISPITSGGAWSNLLALALIPTVISNVTLMRAVKLAGATTASVLGSAEPVVAVLTGFLVFAESFTPATFLGLAIIILAVVWVIRSSGGHERDTVA